jgi:DNA invertase Pin-like site-specific DNA recombinase
MQHAFGYARVSAPDQNLDTQLEDLTRAGCSRIFQEKVSGTRTSSPALTELLAAVREGDPVIVNRLARLGRNTGHTFNRLLMPRCSSFAPLSHPMPLAFNYPALRRYL